jgi:magnesium transporter
LSDVIIVHARSTAAADRIDRHSLRVGDPVPADAVWIDLLEPTREEERAIEGALAIDIPTREEMGDIEPSSNLYVEDGAVVMTARVLSHSEGDIPRVAAIGFILKAGVLVTLRYDEPRSFDQFVSRLARPGVCRPSGEAVLAMLLETVIDRAAEILRLVGERIDGVANEIFEAKKGLGLDGKSDFRGVLKLLGREGDRVSKVRESLVSIERMLLFLSTRLGGGEALADLRADLKLTLRDVQSLEDHATFLNDKVQFMLDALLGLVTLEQNATVKTFSVLAVIFMPPTLIASIYGMNFETMPELKWVWGYPMALGLMVLAALISLIVFRWRNWL